MSDFESDDDIPELALSPSGNIINGQLVAGLAVDDDRRAHHNALERKRRDHIKDSFSMLREVVPTLKGEKASRALILKKAADYIHYLKNNIASHQKDILELKRQNAMLETQVNAIEGGSDFANCLPLSEQVTIDAQASTSAASYDEIGKPADQNALGYVRVSSSGQDFLGNPVTLTNLAPMPVLNFPPKSINEPVNQ